MNDKLYAKRDVEILDDKGDYYFNHIFAMTGEGLHSKSDIAAELGYRDMRIDELKADNAELIDLVDEMSNYLNINGYTNIGNGSVFHKQMIELINKHKENR
ncbi:coil containing protein [Vibrio phage 1.074.O._10N.222.49.B7]|nr:coil containing protein [Vibrio phage 1.074.O._10N.222.49.B7]